MFRSQEQADFANIVASHIAAGTAPLLLEGGTGLGKTRAYLHALVASGKRVAIVLPTHSLIDQLLGSADLAAIRGDATVAAFRPARLFQDSPNPAADYAANRQEAIAARIMICTAASVIIDQRLGGEYNGVIDREYILFDEADQLPDMAALQTDFAISRAELADMGIRRGGAAEVIAAVLKKPTRSIPAETRAAARVIQEALDNPASYRAVGLDDEGGVVLKHMLPGRLLKKISNRPTVAFVSATLTIGGSFADFQRAMGIDRFDALSTMIEPRKHGRLEFQQEHWVINTPEWEEAFVRAVTTAPKPILVATPSYDMAQRLGALLPGAIVRDRGESTAEAVAGADATSVVIAAGAWAGLDTPLRWRTIVVPKVPYPQVSAIDNQILTHYVAGRNTAVRRLRQVIGRGLRTPDAECLVILLDYQIKNLSGFVPERFMTAWNETRSWEEGDRYEVTLSKSERRDSGYREPAFRQYGRDCMALDCTTTVRHTSQLDIHHRFPLEDGKRTTTLDDLRVYCAACHRLAHTRNPPYELDIERVI